jgi:hypothetical protein
MLRCFWSKETEEALSGAIFCDEKFLAIGIFVLRHA